MAQFLFNLQTVAPVFLLAFLGIFLRKIKLLDEGFVSISSKIVFNVALPALVFLKLCTVNFKEIFSGKMLIFVYATTIGAALIIWLITIFFIKKPEDRGVFVQGSFRSNYAIVGFAVMLNRFGDGILTEASLILVAAMPLYNVLAVIILSTCDRTNKAISFKRILLTIITNPLVLAALLSLPFSLMQIHIPSMITRTLQALSGLTLPVALLGIGASLHLDAIKKSSHLAFLASSVKLIILPLLMTWLALKFGFRGESLVVIMMLYACPTSISSYIMAREMGGNGKLAGNIVLISTLLSSITLAIGLYLLELANLI